MLDSGAIDASQQLMDLVFTALDHAVDSVRNGAPLVPFVIEDNGEKRSLTRYAGPTLEGSLARAKEAVAELPSETRAYVLAYDAFVTLGDKQEDAVIVEAAEAGAQHVLTFAQRYRPKGRLRRFKVIGNPLCMGA